jgi:hypothetical protein
MRYGDLHIPAGTPGAPPSMFAFQPTLDIDPDALAIFFGDKAMACDAPFLGEGVNTSSCNPGDAFWQRLIILPPELNRPGVIDLRDMRIFGYEATWLSSCGGGSGNFPGGQGTLEIVSSDPSSLTVKVSGADLQGWGPVDGDYVVSACGALPAAAPPSPAVAARGAAPPGGPAVDPDTLFIRLGSESASCGDPFAAMACDGDSRLSFTLPASLQKTGVLNLSDPAIGAQHARTPGDGAPSCAAVTGAMSDGSVEILAIDETSVSLRVYRSYVSDSTGTFEVDGLYTATICP